MRPFIFAACILLGTLNIQAAPQQQTDAATTRVGLRPVLQKGEHHRMRTLPPWARGIFRLTVGRIDSLRDTVALIPQKPRDWKPSQISAEAYRGAPRRFIRSIEAFNLANRRLWCD